LHKISFSAFVRRQTRLDKWCPDLRDNLVHQVCELISVIEMHFPVHRQGV